MVTEKKKDFCTGCGGCTAICPKHCLSIVLDENGFYQVSCDESVCIHCDLCDKVCPKFAQTPKAEAQCVLSVVSNNEDTLQTTSSGGLCYELAKAAIEKGKKVCACIYNYDEHRAEHVVISDMDALEETKGSKYFQSYTQDAFSQLFDGDDWVVFGSPCQIAALDVAAKIKKSRHKFLLVDFFCHGTPSMNLWKKYIAENGGESVQKIDFRSKEFGWHTFSLRFTHKNGTTFSDFQDNMFYTFFFNNLCLSNACYSCQFKAMNSAADIRVGDFWGDKYKDDKKGVSCCVVFTDRGQKAIEDIASRCLIRNELSEQVLAQQMTKSPSLPRQRKKVLRALKGKRSLKMINNTTLFFYRVKCKIQSIMRKVK